MGCSVDPATGESIGESAMAELGHPVEQSERSGRAAAAPSSEKYTYFFVPAMTGDTADALAGDAFGALLRLGSYSDIEGAARDIRPQADHYPRHHLRDEGGPDAALSQASGGRQGIMLACDGRILLRSKEKMFVDTGDYDQYSSGNYDLEVEGTMRLATTGSPGGITISSEQDTLTLESGPDQNITFNAGDGTGDIIRRAKTSTKVILGQEFTRTTGARNNVTLGTSIDFYAGGTFSGVLGGNLYINGGADLFIRSTFYAISLHAIDCRFIYQDKTKFFYNRTSHQFKVKDSSQKEFIWTYKNVDVDSSYEDVSIHTRSISNSNKGTVSQNTKVKADIGGAEAQANSLYSLP